MSYTAQVKGASADRFRAYGPATMTRKPRLADHKAMTKKGKEFKPGQRVKYTVEQVALEGTMSGAHLSLDSKDVRISRVVFYAGPPEEEVVVGSVDIGAAGTIVIDLVEPEGAAEEISEDDLVE